MCRKCRVFLAEDSFGFAPVKPPELKHTYYCGGCHDQTVAPFREKYEATLERARGVVVLFKGSKSTHRLVRKAPGAVEVKDSRDRDETILRLAYLAALADYDALIEVEVSSAKVRNEGWQTSAWKGRGIPAVVVSHARESL